MSPTPLEDRTDEDILQSAEQMALHFLSIIADRLPEYRNKVIADMTRFNETLKQLE